MLYIKLWAHWIVTTYLILHYSIGMFVCNLLMVYEDPMELLPFIGRNSNITTLVLRPKPS